MKGSLMAVGAAIGIAFLYFISSQPVQTQLCLSLAQTLALVAIAMGVADHIKR